MRTRGEISTALLRAVGELATPERGATLRELAAHACVGIASARYTISNLYRSGAVVIARTRRVPYRNRPIAEYALPATAPASADAPHGLGALLAVWGQAAAPSSAATVAP